jgi:hypothetical protein
LTTAERIDAIAKLATAIQQIGPIGGMGALHTQFGGYAVQHPSASPTMAVMLDLVKALAEKTLAEVK